MNNYYYGTFWAFIILCIACTDNLNHDKGSLPQVNWGEIKRIYFESNWVDARYVDILLPEGYDSSISYPVIYMQDGQMLYDNSTTWNRQSWQLADILGQMAEKEDFTPPIVVGIHNNGEKRFAEYFPTGVIGFVPDEVREEMLAKLPAESLGDEYLQFLISELKPYIDENFSTRQGPRNTYIGGASMGALISLYALCEYPSVFSAAACLSTHWLGPEPEDSIVRNAYAAYLRASLPAPMGHRIYFDLGDQGLDAYYLIHQELIDSVMLDLGYVFGKDWLTVYAVGDDHNEEAWNRRIGSALRFMMRNH